MTMTHDTERLLSKADKAIDALKHGATEKIALFEASTPAAHKMLDEITSATLQELQDLSGVIGQLVTEVNSRRDLIAEAIRSHAEFSDGLVQQKRIIAEAIGNIREEFRRSARDLPPAP